MMTEMILFQPQPHAALHRKMVRRVMKRVVADVAEDETGKDGGGNSAKSYRYQEIEQHGQGDAHHWRHHQPAGVVRVIVMNAMEHEVQEFSPTAFRFIMKDVTVNDVFQQRPNQNAKGKQA